MREPNLRTSRLAIAGGLVAAIALSGAGFLIGRNTSPRPDSAPPPAAAPLRVPAPAPAAEPPHILTRKDILALAAQAADAAASGRPVPADMDGKRFDLVLPFGCAGGAPKESDAPLRWRYDAEQETLRVHVAPSRWSLADWGLAADPAQAGMGDTDANGAGAGPGRLEGFWIDRAWSSAETCPPASPRAAASGVSPATPPEQILAIAQWRSDKSRPERAYDVVKRLAPEAAPGREGLRIRLIGRLTRLLGGSGLHCAPPAGATRRPVCLIPIALDELRIENPADGAVLGTWSEPIGQP